METKQTKQDRSNGITTKQISAYSLIDFCIELQKAYKEGYELDLETNQHVPITIGTLMVCTLVKQEQEELPEYDESSEGMTLENQIPVSEEVQQAVETSLNEVVPEVVKPSGKRSKAA